MTADGGSVEFTARQVRFDRGRPPRCAALVDMAMRNVSDEVLWLLIPAVIPAPADGGVFAVEVSAWGEGDASRIVRVAHFLGRAGRYVLALAPATSVRLRNLEIAVWDEASWQSRLDVIVAGSVTVGEDPIEEWLPEPFVSHTDVDADRPVDIIATHATPTRQEVPLVAGPGALTRTITID